jgi:hypothetical protein
MPPTGFIDLADGYTERAFLAELPGIHGRVEFGYRPLLQEEIVAYETASKGRQGMQLREFVAGLLAAKLKSWDLRDGKGQVVAITAPHLLRLKERLFLRLWAVVSGQEAPDGTLDRDDDETRAAAEDLLEAARRDRSVAEVREERLRKNS